MKKYLWKTTQVLIILVILVQVVFAFRWMVGNWETVPSFGDTNEYIDMSQSWLLDEYRPILYPLLIHLARCISETYFAQILFALQTVVSLICLAYCACCIRRIMVERGLSVCEGKKLPVCLTTAYLWTLPMITFMNFTILTDSLATSFLVLMATEGIWLIYGKKRNIWLYIRLSLWIILQGLLREDRKYSMLLFAVILLLIALKRNRIEWRKITAAMLAVCIGSFLVIAGIGKLTQKEGCRGRVKTNLSFVLLDRIVWPNMVSNYDSFPEEIKKNFSLEEAQAFDNDNNNVMYITAPILEERVGKEKAKECYRTMAGIVFSNQPMKVVTDIGQKIIHTLGTPFAVLLSRYGKANDSHNWNITCLSNTTPEITRTYDLVGLWILVRKEMNHETSSL